MTGRQKALGTEIVPFQADGRVPAGTVRALCRSIPAARCRNGVQGTSLTFPVGIDSLLFSLAVVGSRTKADTQHLAQFLGSKRSERFESYRKVRANLQADVQDGSATGHVGLGNLPRLCVRDVFVAHPGDSHRVLESLAEMELGDVVFKRLPERKDLGKSLAVNVLQFSGSRDHSFEILVGQHDCTVDKIAEYGDQLAVVAGLEVLPAEIVVLGFRRIGGQDVPHHVCLAREIFKIFMSPDSPVAGSGDLVALEIEELVGRDVVRQDIAVAVGFEHRREDYAVEDDVVLADEMHKTGVLTLPPFLP